MNTPAHQKSCAKIHHYLDLPVYMNNFTDIDIMNDLPLLRKDFISRQKVI